MPSAYFIIGSNTTENHPVIGMRLRQAVKQRGAKLIVADPARHPDHPASLRCT